MKRIKPKTFSRSTVLMFRAEQPSHGTIIFRQVTKKSRGMAEKRVRVECDIALNVIGDAIDGVNFRRQIVALWPLLS